MLVARADPDVQFDILAGLGCEAVRVIHQIARHEREKVSGFRPRVMPLGPAIAAAGRVAVGQLNLFVTFDAHSKSAHHIRPVWVVGDLAKPLGLALCAVHAVRHIKTFERRIGFRADFDLGFPDERRVWHVAAQAFAGKRRRYVGAVDLGPLQVQLFAVQEKRPVARVSVRRKSDFADHARGGGRKAKGQMHAFDDVAKRRVVFEVNRLRRGVFHR